MAETYTSNLGLTKPDYDSPADISVINSNMDKIDNAVANAGKVKSVNNKIGDVTLTAADVGARPDNWMPTAADVGALPSGGTAVNANALNGKSADEYMLKTDTAADSYKLDGKDSVYYHKKFSHPRNLLDNSDFRNPVNQRRQTSYVGSGYTIDRWYLWSESGVASSVLEGNYFAISPESDPLVALSQRFEKGYLSEEKTYTLAYLDNRGTLHIKNNNVIAYGEGYDYVQIVSDVWIGVLWAALYEGEYTADNLPPYVPKGYAAELVECRRFFQPKCTALGRAINLGYIAISYNFSPPMRIAPSYMAESVQLNGIDNSIYSGDMRCAGNNSYVYQCSGGGNIYTTGEFYQIVFDANADL